jgi:hypothetical protein
MKVLYAELRSKVTGEVYWKHGESRMLGPNETYTLGSVPEFIEWAELRGSVIMMVGPPSEPEPGGSETSLLVQTIDRVTEIFVVLDEPKAPMDPAWVSVPSGQGEKPPLMERQTCSLKDFGRMANIMAVIQPTPDMSAMVKETALQMPQNTFT